LNDIVISRSKDEGAHWTDIRRVNVDPTDDHVNHFTPDVAAYGRVVDVTYDTRDDSGAKPSKYARERYIVSTDNGQAFGGELVVGPPINLRHAAVADGHRAFLGDYQGTAATANAVHVAWTVAQRNGDERYHQALWSATILK